MKFKNILRNTLGAIVISLAIAIGTKYIKNEIKHINYSSQLECILDNIDVKKQKFRQGFEKAYDYVKNDEYCNICVDPNGNLETVNEPISEDTLTGILSNETVICRPNSNFVDYFYNPNDSNDAEFVKKNINYIVFSPNVVKDSKDVGGLYGGCGGVIYIDTKADDSGVKNPKLYESVACHETQHASEDKTYPTLISEKRAFEREAKSLETRIKTDNDPILATVLEQINRRITTAHYLMNFRSDFKDVYPSRIILAKDLLDANVSQKILEKHYLRLKKPGFESNTEFQLINACAIANIVKTKPREKALNELYKIVQNQKYNDSIIQISAASAIKYLCPNSCKTQSTADVGSGKGFYMNFGDNPKKNGIGKFYNGGDSFRVSGLPSLNELINDKRKNKMEKCTGDIPKNIPINKFIYKLNDGDSIEVEERGNTKFIYLPNKEGKPGDSFYRYQVVAEDSNNNGIGDSMFVFYGSNNFKDFEGDIVFKIDKYNGCGEYIKSNISNPYLKKSVPHKDIYFNPIKQSRKWKLECKD